jgi:hypothetical protein
LKSPRNCSIGLAWWPACASAFVTCSVFDMAIPSVARRPRERERPPPSSAIAPDRSKSRRRSDSETTQRAPNRDSVWMGWS